VLPVAPKMLVTESVQRLQCCCSHINSTNRWKLQANFPKPMTDEASSTKATNHHKDYKIHHYHIHRTYRYCPAEETLDRHTWISLITIETPKYDHVSKSTNNFTAFIIIIIVSSSSNGKNNRCTHVHCPGTQSRQSTNFIQCQDRKKTKPRITQVQQLNVNSKHQMEWRQ